MKSFTEVNPDKGTKTEQNVDSISVISISLQKLTPIRGRKRENLSGCYSDSTKSFTEANPDKGTKTLVHFWVVNVSVFTEANPDKGTKTFFISLAAARVAAPSLQKLTPIRGRKHYRTTIDKEFSIL